jgi:adenine deaminase
VHDGHINGLVARLVAGGVPLPHAVKHASYVPAQHYGLRDRGAVAPGYRADLLVWMTNHPSGPRMVIKNGRIVAEGGQPCSAAPTDRPDAENTVHLEALDESVFVVPCRGGRLSAIGIVEDQIITKHEVVACASDPWQFDPAIDQAMVACVQRHRSPNAAGVGVVTGFGFRIRGALGSTVGHDAHNLMLAGTHGEEMALAARAAADLGGGFVVVREGQVIESLPLPLAGLMSLEPVDTVIRQQESVNRAAQSLGIGLHSPFGTLSFLGLSVIPDLRMTDRGLLDVTKMQVLGSES